ncbi:MAG: hypothetical protein WA102_06360 [Candidatus Methanoperedens sp.]
MEKKLRFFFDKKGDVLDMVIGKPKGAISEEISIVENFNKGK